MGSWQRREAGLILKTILLFVGTVALLLGAVQMASLEWPSAWIPLNTSNTGSNSSAPALAIANEIVKKGEVTSEEFEPEARLFLIWAEPVQAPSLTVSKDKGDSFSSIASLPQRTAPLASPAIVAYSASNQATEKPVLFIAWEEGAPGTREIYLSQSNDGGESFSEPVNVSRSSQGDSHSPALALDGQGGVYIVWVDTISGNNEEIFLQHFSQGALLPTLLNVSRTPTPSLNPTVAVAGNVIYVAWEEDDLRGNREILFQSSAPFSAPMNLSNTPRPSRNPALAADEQGRLFLVWEEEIGGGNVEIFFHRSIDDPGYRDRALLPPIFDVPFNLSDSPLLSRDPAIAIGAAGPVVVWEEGDDILLRSSTDTFQPPLNLSRTPTILSRRPAIAILDDLIAVAWEEQLHDNWEILSITNKATTPLDLIKALEGERGKAKDPNVQIHLARAIEYAQRISGINPRDDFKNEALTLDEIFRAGLESYKTGALTLLHRTGSLLTGEEKRVVCEVWSQLLDEEKTQKYLEEEGVTCPGVK